MKKSNEIKKFKVDKKSGKAYLSDSFIKTLIVGGKEINIGGLYTYSLPLPIPEEWRKYCNSDDISSAGYYVERHYKTLVKWYAGKEYTLKITWNNHKLDGIIMNTSSATNCPEWKCGTCQLSNKSDCYAYARERQFKKIAQGADLQTAIWNEVPAHIIADWIIELLSKGKTATWGITPLGYVKFRFNERGGITGQEMFNKMDEVAEYIVNFYRSLGLRCLAQTFTSRHDITLCNRKCLILRKSGLEGPEYDGRFVVFPGPSDVPLNYVVCREDCRRCAHCHVKGRNCAAFIHNGTTAQAKKRAKKQEKTAA